MTLQQLLLILRARRKVIYYTFGVIVLLTLAISLVLPPQFKASASVVVDVKSPDPLAGIALPALTMPGYMATQIDIINSDRVARKVARLMKLDQVPEIQEQWRDETKGRGELDVWMATLLKKKLDVTPAKESNVIDLSFSSPDPGFAAAVANAFAQAYIETNIELKVEPAKQYSSWFDQQSKMLRERLEAAKSKLSEFQREKGILVSDERLNYENSKLMELQSQLVLAETQLADASSKQKSGSTDTVQDVMQNPVVSQLKSDISRAESKLQEVSGNLGKNHPQYKRQQDELESLKQQLTMEIARVNSSINTSSRVSKEKALELKAAIESHKQYILKLKSERDEVSVLQGEVDAAQRAYDNLAQRQAQANLESQSTQTNISILTPASPPLNKDKPKVVLNVILAAFLGMVIGVGAVLVLELTDRRIRSADDLALLSDIPVLASLSTPITPRRGFFARLFSRHRIA